jgi:hypothetical protein
MNKINLDWYRIVAGDAKAPIFVPIKVRDCDTKAVMFNETITVAPVGKTAIKVVHSDEPGSRLLDISLSLRDLLGEVDLNLNLNSKQDMLRRRLIMSLAAEIVRFRQAEYEREVNNLLSLEGKHFKVEEKGTGNFRVVTAHGLIAVRRTLREDSAIVFTLVRAPKDHPIEVARRGGSLDVLFMPGRLPNLVSTSATGMFAEALLQHISVPREAVQFKVTTK